MYMRRNAENMREEGSGEGDDVNGDLVKSEELIISQ